MAATIPEVSTSDVSFAYSSMASQAQAELHPEKQRAHAVRMPSLRSRTSVNVSASRCHSVKPFLRSQDSVASLWLAAGGWRCALLQHASMPDTRRSQPFCDSLLQVVFKFLSCSREELSRRHLSKIQFACVP